MRRRRYADYQKRIEIASDVKRLCLYSAMIFLAVVAEKAFFATLDYLPAPPDLVIGIVCGVALMDKRENALVCSLVGGVMTDALGGETVYLSPLVYFLLAIILTAFSKKMLKRYPSYLALLGIATVFRGAYTLGMCILLGKMGFLPALARCALPKIISTAVLCLPMYLAVRPASKAFSMGRKGMYE